MMSVANSSLTWMDESMNKKHQNMTIESVQYTVLLWKNSFSAKAVIHVVILNSHAQSFRKYSYM